MTERRSTRRTSGPNDDVRQVWLDRVWNFVTRPWLVGVLLLVAGLVIVLAPTASVPSSPSHGWWIAAYRFSNAAQGSMTLTVAAACFAAAIALQIFRTGRERPWLPQLAVILMGAGIFGGLLTWFVAQADVPTSRVAVAPGQTIDAYPAIESGRAFKVMLPTRIFIASVDADAGRATIELRKPGEDSGIANDVFVGDPLELAGYRIALVGLELDPRIRSAVLTAPGGIERRASAKSKVKFIPDGPEYEVRNIVVNYLGVMGPAVELAGPDGDIFWVTQRGSELDRPFHEIQLLRLESAPVPVFALTKTEAGTAAPTAALVFVLGLVLFLVARDRRPDSLSEAGPAMEDA